MKEQQRLVEESGRHAAWVFAREASAGLARATQEWLADGNRTAAAELARQHANKASHFAAGHAFEFVETLKFNAASARAGETLRAVTTASMGQSTAAADIIISRDGDLVREVQAKFYENAREALNAFEAEKYDGMQRLASADKVEDLRDLLSRRLGMNPDGIRVSGYRDVERNLTGELHHDGVSSGGTSRAEAQRAAGDPSGWLREQQVGSMVNETLAAAAVGAAAGGVFTAAAQSLRLGLAAQHGEIGIAESIVEIATTSATAAVRSGTTSGLAQVIQIGARNSQMFSPLAETTAPVAIASAVISTGQAAYDYALGRTSRDELIDRCGEVALRNTGAWAFGIIGQAVVPVPVVGALVGSTAGYLTSAIVLEGFKLARLAAADADAAEARLVSIEDEIMTAIMRLEECRLTVEATIATEVDVFETTLLPTMDRLESALTDGHASDALDAMVNLNLELGAKLDWSTLPEFDEFMADHTSSLRL
ncbi:hypothetical protein [Egicoccus halophilus]|uniref:Uncharacterized protein n=1 Tax=Egicoccus halophilus TaxID=1670830 RepID=A0A8J3A5V8_9ACTN|nr:hypothetical protein [Egicoccus halophilus]GGI03548.1 hypothetical protein GCM10011354_04580 [Egicoccus halophilus]